MRENESEIKVEATKTGWIVRDGGLEIGPFYTREEAREAAERIARQRYRIKLARRLAEDEKKN